MIYGTAWTAERVLKRATSGVAKFAGEGGRLLVTRNGVITPRCYA